VERIEILLKRIGMHLKLLAENIMFSLFAVILCMGLFYAISVVFNSCDNPKALEFVWQGRVQFSIDTALLERYFHTRDMFLVIGAAVGLASSQVVWYSQTHRPA
jgi:hypothetical protein